jgi:hypothetical protein
VSAAIERRPPKKRIGQATGPRRLDGRVKDVATIARELGDTEKGIRAKVTRGLIPYRRLGSRIIFVDDEISAWLRQLPGVGVDQALENLAARGGEG